MLEQNIYIYQTYIYIRNFGTKMAKKMDSHPDTLFFALLLFVCKVISSSFIILQFSKRTE